MSQKHDLKARKRRTPRPRLALTASELEAMAWELVRTGKASELILTTTRHFYRKQAS